MTRSSARRHNRNAVRVAKRIPVAILSKHYDRGGIGQDAAQNLGRNIVTDRITLSEVNWPLAAELMNRMAAA